jgi:DNA adenine methylase
VQYFGGKARTFKQITNYLESIRCDRPYYEPFCGGMWVGANVSGARKCSDANEALINLYLSIQNGWEPPSEVSEDMYNTYRETQPLDDPLTAFLGIGCSFAGKWFGGFARSGTRNYAKNARNSLLKKMAKCKDVKFFCADYADVLAEAPSGSLFYLDPPYGNVTGFAAIGAFDSARFWDTARFFSKRHVIVVSEYVAPDDFDCVLEISTKTDIRTRGGRVSRSEKLFRLRDVA